jgi:hypothetical protein
MLAVLFNASRHRTPEPTRKQRLRDEQAFTNATAAIAGRDSKAWLGSRPPCQSCWSHPPP